MACNTSSHKIILVNAYHLKNSPRRAQLKSSSVNTMNTVHEYSVSFHGSQEVLCLWGALVCHAVGHYIGWRGRVDASTT